MNLMGSKLLHAGNKIFCHLRQKRKERKFCWGLFLLEKKWEWYNATVFYHFVASVLHPALTFFGGVHGRLPCEKNETPVCHERTQLDISPSLQVTQSCGDRFPCQVGHWNSTFWVKCQYHPGISKVISLHFKQPITTVFGVVYFFAFKTKTHRRSVTKRLHVPASCPVSLFRTRPRR